MTLLDEWSDRRRDLYLTTHYTHTTEKHPCPHLDPNPRSQQASSRRPTPYTARPLGPTAKTMYDSIKPARQPKEILLSDWALLDIQGTRGGLVYCQVIEFWGCDSNWVPSDYKTERWPLEYNLVNVHILKRRLGCLAQTTVRCYRAVTSSGQTTRPYVPSTHREKLAASACGVVYNAATTAEWIFIILNSVFTFFLFVCWRLVFDSEMILLYRICRSLPVISCCLERRDRRCFYKIARPVDNKRYLCGLEIVTQLIQGDKKSLGAPDDYGSKNTQKYFKVSITYHDNVVRIRNNSWR
jgi:hypothetical protein